MGNLTRSGLGLMSLLKSVRMSNVLTYCAVLAVLMNGAGVLSTTDCRAESGSEIPDTVYWDGAHLAALRDAKLQADARYREVFTRLSKNAEISRKRGPYSVMDKDDVPPSGDKHDYLSYARYWWQNPNTKDGLPYVRRDGKTNEDLLAKGDRVPIGKMYDDVETLALAGYLLNDERYSKHAALLVHTWFLDPATRMNPHLRYGQAVPGQKEGRGAGIIDTRYFVRVLDSVALLQQTNAWSDTDQAALVAWMREYLDWLQQDPMGQDEASERNNHGTWYDAQVAAIAMFVGERELARKIVDGATAKRIGRCIEPDGRQPEELGRTQGLHYSVFNMSAMSVLGRIGEHVDVDLWNYESADGRSLRRAVDFVMPFLAGEKEWPHEQIEEIDIGASDMGLFYLAADRYGDPKYRDILDKLSDRPSKFEYVRLQFPGN
jgi:hypothetical protein